MKKKPEEECSPPKKIKNQTRRQLPTGKTVVWQSSRFFLYISHLSFHCFRFLFLIFTFLVACLSPIGSSLVSCFFWLYLKFFSPFVSPVPLPSLSIRQLISHSFSFYFRFGSTPSHWQRSVAVLAVFMATCRILPRHLKTICLLTS